MITISFFLDDVIRENLEEVFPGYTIHGAYSVKLTRDAEMSVEDEFTGDIAEKIEKATGEKRCRSYHTYVFFDKAMPAEVREFVQKYFMLRNEEMAEGGRYHNMKDLGSLPNPKKENWLMLPWPSVAHRVLTIINRFFSVSLIKRRCCTCRIILTITYFVSSMKQLLTRLWKRFM